ncbi:outer membrane beta-barrel domain-containing protein [Vulgatibacter incomptus]|uniref:Outer membrane protein beta-barrel domain-containing protein n=1 Tax=Vulgatibacter incomptus TaxID=1391653 RepID=A0A0K1PF31_9BACT|nr:outer membrane beta-barrel domain-containing protein [Vulgatibacter incomptus]AKU92130.1 hypothetical protein AKJ08_2517 [Vulgatibacter incomptus]
MNRFSVAAVAAALLAVVWSGPANADDLDEGGALYAVQNRKYTASHEFSVNAGSLPMDAFYKGYTASGAYTLHFSDLWAWEVVNAAYSFNVDTDLRRELESNWGVTPTRFPTIQWLGNSNLVVKPLYGKLAWLNGSLLYGELFFTAGPAVASYESDGELQSSGTYVGANVGLGLRFYLSESWSLRLDARDYYFVSPKDVKSTSNELFFSTGISLNVR